MNSIIEKRALEIRKFSRFYTNIIGLVNQTILESPYSLAEVRIMLEIRLAGECTATDLVRMLQIDAGYVSRILRRFKKEQLLTSKKSDDDGRAQVISLTERGCELIDKLQAASTIQAANILQKLPDYHQAKLVEHMHAIRAILSAEKQPEIRIRPRKAGDIGYIAHMHGFIYEKEYGLDLIFEKYVLAGIVKFLESGASGELWVAECEGQIIGSIAVVNTGENTAQLRWFLIDPAFRGTGLGRKLIETALSHCRQNNWTYLFLWTFIGLDAARHLYEQYGFHPTERVENNTWKQALIEERWDAVLD